MAKVLTRELFTELIYLWIPCTKLSRAGINSDGLGHHFNLAMRQWVVLVRLSELFVLTEQTGKL